MLRAAGGYGDVCQTPASLGSYDPAKLSLPEAGNTPVSLETLWGQGGREFVERLVHSITLPEVDANVKMRELGLRSCYSDPLLRHPKTYAQLLRRLKECGLIEFHSQPSRVQAELFFVKKKSGQLRMVVDCRHANCFFKEPLGVALSTGDSLSRIELEPHETLNFCSADLKDAFYHLRLPPQLSHLFGLRSVRACDVGLNAYDDDPHLGFRWDSMVHPRLAVVPMGWNWALWICQTLHERVVSFAGADDSNRLSDKKPFPGGDVLHTEYVDNFHVIGTNAHKVKQLSEHGIQLLRDKGLVVHEEEQSSGSAIILGWEFTSDGTIRPTANRLWKVRLAVMEILRLGSISGQQLERVVGHMSFISMGRREGLAILGDVYTFIRRFYNRPHKLWKGVRRELAIWYAISPLLWRDLRSTWSSTVHATDASEWGCGATVATMDHLRIKELGRCSERWRFADPVFKNPRKAHLQDVVPSEDEFDTFAKATTGNSVEMPQKRSLLSQDCFMDRSAPVFSPVAFEDVDRPWKVVGRRANRQVGVHRKPPVVTGHVELSASHTTLMTASVKPRTLEAYRRHWTDFSRWSRLQGWKLESTEEIDVALSQYMEEAYLEGGDLSMGRYILAAVTFFNPQVKSANNVKLPRCRMSLQGWKNLVPPQSRLPIPWEVCCLLACHALRNGMMQMSLCMLVAFAMYLRPSEVSRIRVRDVVFPAPQLRRRHQQLVITLHPFEDAQCSKTKEFDETVVLDLSHHQFLIQALSQMVSELRLQPNSLLVNMTPTSLRLWMEQVSSHLRLESLGILHPYRLRHGGASTDFWEKHRSLAEIQKRGRWRTPTSVRRYEKGGRIAQLLAALPSSVQQQASWAADNIDKVYVSRHLLQRLR
eukprot:Skav231695  [mRNA]  locus=scaffold597:1206282:1209294:- [translate_table: standard]